ncbi:MAG: hypothetical protein Q4C82_06015 [Eubacteriales bacterium]|nr:hypothetical protein [Eubacteriales bacterium]
MENTYEKLKKLMHSYVPEFAYERGKEEPGCVLTDLCGDMMNECQERYGQVIPKHRIQYLNLFGPMLKEPVSASRGYVQLQPVKGHEGMVPIPKGTRLLASSPEAGEMVFETEHSLTICDAQPVMAVITDRESDRIIRHDLTDGASGAFQAFGVQGENCACHKLYLCFEDLFTGLGSLDLRVRIRTSGEEEEPGAAKLLSGDGVVWSVLEPDGQERPFPSVEETDGAIRLRMEDYTPEKAAVGQKEGYYLTLSCTGTLPTIYIKSLSVSFSGEQIVPREVRLNGNDEPSGRIYPFGKPLGLYNEMTLDDPEALSRPGARIWIKFRLDYRIHEETLELPDMDLEYKAIMKKPKKQASIRPAEVLADYVCWEYKSRTGWKRLLKEEHVSAMFNGSVEGQATLEFVCPDDMADYEEGSGEGRIRARLLQAENIYRVPAVYKCPVISGMTLSYSYEDHPRSASYALAKNNFDERDVTESLRDGGSASLFFQTEHARRTMYLGFDRSVAGMPFSLYFDIENDSDRAVEFQAEYLSDRGFLPVRTVDYTEGFCGSGAMLLMIPEDMEKRSLFGREGYFLRFVSAGREHPEYALPRVKGIYPNMARIVNVNTVTEEFYLDDTTEAVRIQLSQQNLLKAEVWIREQTGRGEEWVLWKKAEQMYEGGRSYQLDMASGELSFRKYAFADFALAKEGPLIRVAHSNYSGGAANLPAHAITTPGTAIRYLSGVTNPFPTYGGYDGYTEDAAMRLVTGMLRTRNRAVTARDFFDLISQVSYGVRKVKCVSHADAYGNTRYGNVTIAVLVEEYEKGAHVFSGLKQAIRDRLARDSALFPSGKSLTLIQPYFIRLSVRVWIEKDSMDQAYELQQQALEELRQFIDPLKGGVGGRGWEIGELPRMSQLTARLRTRIAGCSISRMVMTALVDGKELTVTDEFYENMKNPFLMAVNGEHRVYIEVSEC